MNNTKSLNNNYIMLQALHWIKGTLPFILLGLLSLALASCSDDDTSSSKFGIGTVTGVITDDYDVPLSGVTVALDDSIAPGATTTVTTDAQGQFTMSNVTMGKNVLIFTKQDYQTMSVTVTPKSFTDGKAIINASMEYAAAKIRGTVLDAQHGNQPLAGATVAVNGMVRATTGQDGTFLVDNLPLNNYTVTVAKTGYTSG